MVKMSNLPKLCEDDFKLLVRKFSSLASGYTPEWRFDASDNDFGVTFGRIFCDMHEDTVERLNKSVNNIYLTLLELVGVELLPCTPSKCMAFIKAAKNSKPHVIKKGSKITSSGDSYDVLFETDYDFFVLDNDINNIFMSSKNTERLVKVFNFNQRFKEFQIFNFDSFENLQKRYIYIYDENLFDVCGSHIHFRFKNKFSPNNEKKMFNSLCDALWEFFDGKNWIKISELEKSNDCSIKVKFDKRPMKCRVSGLNSIYIRISVSDCDIHLSDISYRTDEISIVPDQLFSNDEIVDQSSSFLPFNEKFYLYDTFAIKCDEAFNKPGAKISVSVDMSFISVNSEYKNYVINYKMIMSDVDFAESEPIDVNIEKVVWEYSKDDSWIPLKVLTKDADKFFCSNLGSGVKVLEFMCPPDVSSRSFLSSSGLFIRARIVKISNQYSNYFNYMSPSCKDMKIEYLYESPHKCNEIISYSNLEYKKIDMISGEKEEIDIFNARENSDFSIYLNLKNPILDGILNIFFNLKDDINQSGVLLRWEYWAKGKNNVFAWKTLRIVDYTGGFSKSGTVRVLGAKDFAKANLFGESGYFIKISLIGDEKIVKYFPIISDIKLNSVEVTQKETSNFEYFFANEYEKNKICSISAKRGDVFDLDVWVDEKESISSDECSKFISQNPEDIEIEKNSDNTIKKVWIRWNRVNNLLAAKPFSRAYEFDNKSQKIRFGDGKHGKFPSEVYGRNIRIKYCTSEGENGNIDEMSINGFSSNFSYVSSVYNSERAYGGTNIESLEHASERTFAQIATGNRLVSKEGFERGILFNDRRIFRVKCFSHIDKYENENEGCITIVVLPKDYMRGLKNFSIIRKNVINFIDKNAPIGISNSNRIFVSEASYVKFSFGISVLIDDYRNYQSVYDKICSNIKKFLDPIRGGESGNGFQIGSLPSKSDILNKIRFVEGGCVQQFEIFTKVLTEYGEKEILLDDANKLKFTIPVFEAIDLDIKFESV